MMHRTLSRRFPAALLSFAAATALGSFAWSQQAPVAAVDPSTFSLAQAAPTPDTTPEDGLMQSEMKDRGMGGNYLDEYGIKVRGYVDMGFNFNFDRPVGDFNGPHRSFDIKSDDPTFNQLSLIVSRDAIISSDRFDTGFTFQVIYGSDARFTQANGTNFYGSGYAGKRSFTFIQDRYINSISFVAQNRPDEQIDILQGYMTFNLPWYNGMLLKAGKFVTPWGVEKIDPTQTPFYSRGVIFSLSSPMTLTGVTVEGKIDDQWSAMGGVVVGWNQSLEDNNDFPSFLAQATYKFSNDLSGVLTLITGPEQEDNRSDYRTILDLTIDWQIDPQWHAAAEGVYGYEPDVGTSYIRPGAQFPSKFQSLTFKDATWNGLAGYIDYKVDEDGMFVLRARGEIFNDGDGGRLVATQVYDVTGGVSIRPFVHDRIGKNLILRPELRWDYSDQNIFDGNTRTSQITFEADAMFTF